MKTKMILLMLALLITVSGKAKAIDLKQIDRFDFYDTLSGSLTYFKYNELANKLYFGNDYVFKIFDITKKIVDYSENADVDIRVSPNYYFRKSGNGIKKIDPLTNQIIFTFSLIDKKIIIWNLSEDGNHLILLTENSGTQWYKDCELLFYNTLTNALEKQLTYQLNLQDEVPNEDYNFVTSLIVSSNLQYVLIDWERINGYWNTNYNRNGIMGLDIVNLETNQRIQRLNNKRSLCFSTTSDTLAVSNWQWKEYENGNRFTYDSSNMINIMTGLPVCDGKKILTGNSNQFIGNYLITSQNIELNRIILNSLKSEVVKSNYPISEFTIQGNKLIALDLKGGSQFTIYDITNITGVNEPIKETILYPNPTSHLLNLDLDYSLDYDVQIIDEAGKMLDSFPISNSYQLNYDTSRLPKGMYILQLTSKTSSKNYKFLKE
jgi:hypothetical protein